LFFGKGVRNPAEPWLQRRLKSGYSRTLAFAARWPRLMIVSAIILCVAVATRIPSLMGGEFLPEFREGHFVLQVFATPGTSLPETLRIGKQISDELLRNTNIDTVEQQ